MTMVRRDVSSATEVNEEIVQAKAAQVGADILTQYQELARDLRRRGWEEAAAMGTTLDPTERASRQCAFQLYGTAASELDDIIADLLDSLDHPFTGMAKSPTLRVLNGGKANGAIEDGPRG
jgi:hypothetical protein